MTCREPSSPLAIHDHQSQAYETHQAHVSNAVLPVEVRDVDTKGPVSLQSYHTRAWESGSDVHASAHRCIRRPLDVIPGTGPVYAKGRSNESVGANLYRQAQQCEDEDRLRKHIYPHSKEYGKADIG